MKKTTEKELPKIAKKHLVDMEWRDDLATHLTDSEDFLDVAIWELRAALEAAYELGRADAKK